MKKIIVALALMIAVVVPSMAQYNKEKDLGIMIGMQFNHFATGWTHPVKLMILSPLTERWSVGGGWMIGWASSDIELQRETMPFESLNAKMMVAGLNAIGQYLLFDNNSGRHSLMFQMFFGLSGLDFEAEDERAEHIESGENIDYTSYSYTITPVNEKYWGPRFQVTPLISYAYEWDMIHLELGVGYDLINPIRKEYRDAPTTLSSDWDDFNTYYPTMSVNPFKEWDCGRKMRGMYGLHVCFTIAINLYD